jgi:hypothetical protein
VNVRAIQQILTQEGIAHMMVIWLMSFATADQQQHVLTHHALLQIAQLVVQEIGAVVYALAALLGMNILVSRLCAVQEPVQLKIQAI